EGCTDTILRQVDELGRMVEEFSTFARMPKPSMATFDLAELVRQVAFSQQMVSPDLKIDVDIQPGAVSYRGDERLLGQALQNLIKNAAEAIARLPADTDETGAMAITLSESDDGRMSVTIVDNGPGFPDTNRQRLLEPYVTTREKGTGLGLAIVNRIIMDHGGTLLLHDRTDGRRGANVVVSLPIQDLDLSPPDARPERESQLV
ncbi:MAG: ATP-binding protein, partial [Pseudomonadota bacterium]